MEIIIFFSQQPLAKSRILRYLGEGSKMLEASPFEKLATDSQMMAKPPGSYGNNMDKVTESVWDFYNNEQLFKQMDSKDERYENISNLANISLDGSFVT